eukprot:3156356-Amphidinium_carterae.1
MKEATAPKGEQVKLDWFLTSKTLVPACGLEDTDLKPEEPQITDNREVEAGYLEGPLAAAEEALAAAKQHALVAGLKRQVLAFGPCASLEWPDILGPHPLESEQQLNCMDACYQNTTKADAKKRRDGWNQYVKDMWRTAPKKRNKWIRETIVVWDLATTMMDTPTLWMIRLAWSLEPGASSGGQVLPTSRDARLKQEPLGLSTRSKISSSTAPMVKQAVKDLTVFLKRVEATASWPTVLRERLLWSAACKADRSAAGQHQVGHSGVCLDCSKCYERVLLRMLEEFALESAYPLHALNVALNMHIVLYNGSRCILVKGAISEGVTARVVSRSAVDNAVDMMHAFLVRSLRCPSFPHCGQYASQLASDCCGLNVNYEKFGVPEAGPNRDLGVDTQWFAWRNLVQQKHISFFNVSMNRTRALGLPAHVKARIVKSLFSAALSGAEVGGHRFAALELMACGGQGRFAAER